MIFDPIIIACIVCYVLLTWASKWLCKLPSQGLS